MFLQHTDFSFQVRKLSDFADVTELKHQTLLVVDKEVLDTYLDINKLLTRSFGLREFWFSLLYAKLRDFCPCISQDFYWITNDITNRK